jgi:tRNA (cmo5U34)-methyltransferase
MKSALNRFDKIASVYDAMVKLVYGRSIYNSQINFISELPQKGNVLILGGGTGWILDEISRIAPGLTIWYIEASEVMLRKSKERAKDTLYIHFIHGTEKNLPEEISYDAIITNFYLDLFPVSKLTQVVRLIISAMKVKGVWLAADFTNQNKWWQKILLSVMYKFFKVVSDLEAKTLPPWDVIMLENGLEEKKSKRLYGGFIKSAVYTIANEE